MPIDVSATIQGHSFSGAQGLGQYIHDSPQYPACVARRLYSYSRGVRSWSVNDFPDAYKAFQNSGFRLRALLKSMALSDSFYAAAPPATLPKEVGIEIKEDLMKLNRRSLLRGSCQGALAVMGLPFLDCFLNSKGQAQTNGRALPTRFNTFFWGCGLTASLWIPKTAGTDYEMTVQLKPLEPYRKKLNVFSGLRVPLDSKPNGQHWSGLAAAITGIAPFQGRRVRVQDDRPAGG